MAGEWGEDGLAPGFHIWGAVHRRERAQGGRVTDHVGATGLRTVGERAICARLHSGVELDADEDGAPCGSALRAGTTSGGLWREPPAAGARGAAAQRDG